MKSRILLKEIPYGKFHSVIFTTYSINLYYLEQQVMPLLGSKDVHYLSVLADSRMLSEQLQAYSSYSQQKKRSYAIHGIQSDGAFHPKLIFLAGTDSILLLIGSGNLTTSGHGKNLEVWNPIYVDDPNDNKLGFALHAWHYLKRLHDDLGDSAQNKLNNIEENCSLLSKSLKIDFSQAYEIDENTQVSFLSANPDISLAAQLSELVGNEKIDRITIMSPFYDVEGNFIQDLNKRYQPREINIILQEEFGAIPYKMKPKSNMHFFEWSDIRNEESKQAFFHAKNLIFESRKKSFLVSGSANASLAAFGSLNQPGSNQESCIVYQSKTNDFIDKLGLNLKKKKVSLSDYEPLTDEEDYKHEGVNLPVFIKSAEKNYNEVTLNYSSKKAISFVQISLFDPAGQLIISKEITIEKGDSKTVLKIPGESSLMYAEALNKSKRISNKQFIIDVNAFEGTNPSPRNRSLNQIRKILENGDFSTAKIIGYLSTITKQKELNKAVASKGSTQIEKKELSIQEEESDLLYMSYAEIQEKAKQIVELQKHTIYIEYKGVRLWESIFAYLKESRENAIQAKVDAEETENINNPGEGPKGKKEKNKKSIQRPEFQRHKDRIEKFLNDYWEILASKRDNINAEQPTLIDLSMFLVMLEILLHLVSHKELIEENNTEESLLIIPFVFKDYSWSEYLLQFIGMFTLWCNQTKGFKDVDSSDYRLKMSQYQKMAFKTCVSGLSIFNYLNQSFDKRNISQWLTLSLLNCNQTFNSDNSKYRDVEEFLEFVPQNVLEEFDEGTLSDEIHANLAFLHKFRQKIKFFNQGETFSHPSDGFTFIEKKIVNQTTTLLKLYRPGYEWDEHLKNYWNSKLYHLKQARWIGALK